MNSKIKLSVDFLDKLNDEEICLLINTIPNKQLLYPIKKYPKEFRNETRGCKIDVKSKLLMNRLPKIYFDRIKKGDGNIINFVKMNVSIDINTVNDHIFEVTSDEDFLKETIASNDINKFFRLIDIILDVLEPKHIKLFFKLIDQKLSDEQNNYIDTQLQIIIMERKTREKISKELEQKYEEKITNIQNVHKTENVNQIEKK